MRRKSKVEVWIRTSFVSFHCWPDAPEQVAYLRALHRHNFQVKVKCEVNHMDRDVEFHMLKTQVEASIVDLLHILTENRSMSCEMLADALFRLLKPQQLPIVQIEISEDGECGAIVHFDNELS